MQTISEYKLLSLLEVLIITKKLILLEESAFFTSEVYRLLYIMRSIFLSTQEL